MCCPSLFFTCDATRLGDSRSGPLGYPIGDMPIQISRESSNSENPFGYPGIFVNRNFEKMSQNKAKQTVINQFRKKDRPIIIFSCLIIKLDRTQNDTVSMNG